MLLPLTRRQRASQLPAATGEAAQRIRWRISAFILPAFVLATIVVAAAIGPVRIPLSDVLITLAQPLRLIGINLPEVDPVTASLVGTVRLPRAVLAAIVGAGLAVAGAVMQAVFRNPLAEPGITGVSAGAAVAAVITIVTGLSLKSPFAIPLAAFIGAIVATAAVQLVAGIRRQPATLLLVGIAVNALLGAVISAALANAPDPDDVRRVMFWLNGDLTGSTWTDVRLAIVPILVGTALLMCFTRELDLLALSDETAAATGVNTVRVRQTLLATAAVVTAAGVAVTGIIAFVGLVVPHLVRLAIGPSHSRLLPLSAGIGAAFLCLADLGARMIFNPVVLQTGTITAIIGAPALLLLIAKSVRS